MAGTRHTRHEAIRFTYKQMQHRDMLFRYANRHDFIVRPSDCSPRAIFLSLSSSPFSLSLFFSLLFFVICTPNRAELLQYGSGGGGGSAGSRKSQINPFVIPHRSFQPVRISTTRFYATSAPSQNSFSLLLRLPIVLSREKTALSRFYLSFSRLFSTRITLFSSFFFPFTLLFFVAFWPKRALVRFLFFFCIFFLIYRSYRIISVQVSAARSNRVCFVCFSCVNFNSDFLAIHAYRHYDIWRRGLRLKEGFVRVSKLRSSQSRAPTGIGRHAKRGTRQRDLLKQHEQRDFLSYLSFFFWRERSLYRISCVPLPFWYIYRAIITSSNVFSFGSDHRSFELCRAMPRLLIAIKERQFGKYEKIREFFSTEKEEVFFILASCHFYPAYVKSLFILVLIQGLAWQDERDITSKEEEIS